MTTQVAQIEDAAQIANAQEQANSIGSASTVAVSSSTFVFFAAFDGTNNTSVVNPATGLTYSRAPQVSAVAELAAQVTTAAQENQNTNTVARYYINP